MGLRLTVSPDGPGAEVYPFAVTTYRLTEHFTAGGMSRWTPYLAELQPEFFCEVSPLLAAERGLENGGWATIVTARIAIEARVLVTERIRPIDARTSSSRSRNAPNAKAGRSPVSPASSTSPATARSAPEPATAWSSRPSAPRSSARS